MRLKTELFLLLTAIGLYVASSICYSYADGGLPLGANYTYRFYAYPLIGLASVLLVIGAISYSKRK